MAKATGKYSDRYAKLIDATADVGTPTLQDFLKTANCACQAVQTAFVLISPWRHRGGPAN